MTDRVPDLNESTTIKSMRETAYGMAISSFNSDDDVDNYMAIVSMCTKIESRHECLNRAKSMREFSTHSSDMEFRFSELCKLLELFPEEKESIKSKLLLIMDASVRAESKFIWLEKLLKLFPEDKETIKSKLLCLTGIHDADLVAFQQDIAAVHPGMTISVLCEDIQPSEEDEK